MINISEDNFVIYCIVFSSICHLLDFGTHFSLYEGKKWSRGEKSMAMAIVVAIETKAEQIYEKTTVVTMFMVHQQLTTTTTKNIYNKKHIQQKYNANSRKEGKSR